MIVGNVKTLKCLIRCLIIAASCLLTGGCAPFMNAMMDSGANKPEYRASFYLGELRFGEFATADEVWTHPTTINGPT